MTMKILCALLLASTSLFAQSYTYNVKTFGGAKCDGVTDDTAAIQATYAAAVAAITRSGGNGGPVYFPPSSGSCKFSTLKIPASPQGPLVSVFDNSIAGNQIFVNSGDMFIGNSGSNMGLNPFFFGAPTASWQQLSGATTSFVEADNANAVYFRGLNIQSNNYTQMIGTVNLYNSVWFEFDHCAVGPPYSGAPALTMNLGFGFRAEHSSFTNYQNTPYAVEFLNTGMVAVDHSYVGSVLMEANEPGLAGMFYFDFNDILSENIQNQSWLTINGQTAEISMIDLHEVHFADSTNAHLIKNLLSGGDITVTNSDFGAGLVDPASTPAELSLRCFGHGCENQYTLNVANGVFYEFVGQGARSPLVVYGSQYVPNMLQQLGPKNF
jgi:hypothetical protein